MTRLTAPEFEQLATAARAPRDAPPTISADLLFRAALLESSIAGVSWRAFAALSSHALLHIESDVDAWERATFARDIARRHIGERAPLEWPAESAWFGQLDADAQLAALAHVVQSVADGDLELVAPYAEAAVKALDALPPREATLMLLGAVGRAYAAVGAYAEATLSLQRAVEGWFALNRVASASHAICELLRVQGVRRDAAAVRGLEVRAAEVLDAAVDPISRTFIRLALGRALLQVGDVEAGRSALELDVASWDVAPAHVRASRLRWLHFAELVRGDEAAAHARLEELDALTDDGLPYRSDQQHLARIDRALARGTRLNTHVEDLLAADFGGDEAARTLARLAPHDPRAKAMNDRAIVARLASEYRY